MANDLMAGTTNTGCFTLQDETIRGLRSEQICGSLVHTGQMRNDPDEPTRSRPTQLRRHLKRGTVRASRTPKYPNKERHKPDSRMQNPGRPSVMIFVGSVLYTLDMYYHMLLPAWRVWHSPIMTLFSLEYSASLTALRARLHRLSLVRQSTNENDRSKYVADEQYGGNRCSDGSMHRDRCRVRISKLSDPDKPPAQKHECIYDQEGEENHETDWVHGQKHNRDVEVPSSLTSGHQTTHRSPQVLRNHQLRRPSKSTLDVLPVSGSHPCDPSKGAGPPRSCSAPPVLCAHRGANSRSSPPLPGLDLHDDHMCPNETPDFWSYPSGRHDTGGYSMSNQGRSMSGDRSVQNHDSSTWDSGSQSPGFPRTRNHAPGGSTKESSRRPYPCVFHRWNGGIGDPTPYCRTTQAYVSRLAPHHRSRHPLRFLYCTKCFRTDFDHEHQVANHQDDCVFRCVTEHCRNYEVDPPYNNLCNHGLLNPQRFIWRKLYRLAHGLPIDAIIPDPGFNDESTGEVSATLVSRQTRANDEQEHPMVLASSTRAQPDQGSVAWYWEDSLVSPGSFSLSTSPLPEVNDANNARDRLIELAVIIWRHVNQENPEWTQLYQNTVSNLIAPGLQPILQRSSNHDAPPIDVGSLRSLISEYHRLITQSGARNLQSWNQVAWVTSRLLQSRVQVPSAMPWRIEPPLGGQPSVQRHTQPSRHPTSQIIANRPDRPSNQFDLSAIHPSNSSQQAFSPTYASPGPSRPLQTFVPPSEFPQNYTWNRTQPSMTPANNLNLSSDPFSSSSSSADADSRTPFATAVPPTPYDRIHQRQWHPRTHPYRNPFASRPGPRARTSGSGSRSHASSSSGRTYRTGAETGASTGVRTSVGASAGTGMGAGVNGDEVYDYPARVPRREDV